MPPWLESFLERPTSHKVGVLILSLVLVLGLFWMLVYSDKLEEEQQLSLKVDSLRSEITNERRLAKNLDKFRQEVADLNVKLQSALRQLPDKREIPDFLASIEKRAREAGLEVTLFRPAPERIKEFYAEVPVTISVDGTFHQIATFFDEVGRLPRVVNIVDLIMKQPTPGETGMRIKTDCTAVTFRYLDDAERARAAEASKEASTNKKRRKK